ncbi:hypothetical protein [Burkholderia cepacia]|uniref:hypothetical protein n=1 Tax=Burkholderia cepacia TaxID=292 RepID=UPI002FE27045
MHSMNTRRPAGQGSPKFTARFNPDTGYVMRSGSRRRIAFPLRRIRENGRVLRVDRSRDPVDEPGMRARARF